MVDITPDVIADFRAKMTAYTDITKWPDAAVTDALCESDAETGGSGWGGYQKYIDECRNFKMRGMYYFAAHWLYVTFRTGTAENPEDVSGGAQLNVAAKSVGDASITYRVGAIQSTEDDWLSLSNYGVQYLRLRARAGRGARAV